MPSGSHQLRRSEMTQSRQLRACGAASAVVRRPDDEEEGTHVKKTCATSTVTPVKMA